MRRCFFMSFMLAGLILALSLVEFRSVSPKAGARTPYSLPKSGMACRVSFRVGRTVDETDLVPVKVRGVVSRPDIVSPAVLLFAEEEGLFLPIFVGQLEAIAILRGIEKVEAPRPMTHDLILMLMERFDAKIDRVIVTRLDKGTFFAELEMQLADGSGAIFDARPSDSIALALMAKADIYVSRAVLDEAGQAPPDPGDEAPPSAPERSSPEDLPFPI